MFIVRFTYLGPNIAHRTIYSWQKVNIQTIDSLYPSAQVLLAAGSDNPEVPMESLRKGTLRKGEMHCESQKLEEIIW